MDDGSFLVGGSFDWVNSSLIHNLVLMSKDGRPYDPFDNRIADYNFNLGTGANGGVSRMKLLRSGKILILGQFSQFNGVARNQIARLNSDGTLDISFSSNISVSPGGFCGIEEQEDDRILISCQGSMTVNGKVRTGLARLNPDGSLDELFHPSFSGLPNDNIPVRGFKLQSDGRIIVFGTFERVNGIRRRGVAQLDRHGCIEKAFGCDFISGEFVVAAADFQADSKILIGGNFTSVNGYARNSMARIEGNVETNPVSNRFWQPCVLPEGVAMLTLNCMVGTNYVLQGSSNLVDWIDLTNFTAIHTFTDLQDFEVTNNPARFYRAWAE